jgi:hypothetical protein
VRRSIVLRANPSVRQTQEILARLERTVIGLGATTDRGPSGEMGFRMPPPWRFAPIGWVGLITRGTATLSAWGGGPWRVSYRLYFGALRAVTMFITLVLVALGWEWPRLSLLSAVLSLWLVGYGALHLLAAHQFRGLLSAVMADVIDRRARARTPPATPSQSASSQHPE